MERKVGKEGRVPTSLASAASLDAPNACAVEDKERVIVIMCVCVLRSFTRQMTNTKRSYVGKSETHSIATA